LPAHNQALAGDTLTAIQLNHEWRKIVASALYFYFRHNGKTELAYDNDDFLSVLLEDLYTAESFGGMLTTLATVTLPALQTTTSTVFVAVPNSSFSHIFTKPNAVIRCSNIVARNNSAGSLCEIQVRVAGASGVESGNAGTITSTNHALECVARFEGIETVVSKTVELYFRVASGTGVITANAPLVFEIEEYD
jgi:hypothetical protein